LYREILTLMKMTIIIRLIAFPTKLRLIILNMKTSRTYMVNQINGRCNDQLAK